MSTVTVNGRKYFYSRIQNVRRVCGTYYVDTFHGGYTIWGGKAAGGSSRDWFVEGEHIKDYIVCNSVVDALTMLDSM